MEDPEVSLIAGCDFSTHFIDLVLLDEDGERPPVWNRYPLEGKDAFDRARAVFHATPSRGWWTDQGVVAVGIEDPRGYGSGHLFRIQGAIMAGLPGHLLVHPLVPSQWRKLVGLKGNASKAQVYDHAQRGLFESRPVTFEGTYLAHLRDWTQDACDAYCIAVATRGLLVKESVPV